LKKKGIDSIELMPGISNFNTNVQNVLKELLHMYFVLALSKSEFWRSSYNENQIYINMLVLDK